MAPPSLRASRIVAVAATVVLAAGVGLLAALAIERSRPSGPVGTAAPAPTFSFRDATPRPTVSTSPPSAPDQIGLGERFVAVQGDRIWRATAGSCGRGGTNTPSIVERSTDGGITWLAATPPDAGRVLSVSVYTDDGVEIVAASAADCSPLAYRSYTAGQAWETRSDVVGAATYVSPSEPGTVVIAGAAVAAPCDAPRSARTSRGTTGIVCDRTAYGRTEGEWSSLVSDAAAVDAEAGTVVVAHASPRCSDGVAVTRFDGIDGTELGCISGVDATAPAALSVLGDEVVLWSGDRMHRLD